jgi:hypothetical protein
VNFFELPFHWYRKFSPHWLFWLGLPIALYSWTLRGPLLSDDLHLVLKAEQYIRGESNSLELYRFAKSDEQWRAMRDRGTCPWWLPSSMRLDCFRPVAGLSFYLDVQLLGRNPLGYRLVSLAVFFVALLCVHRLFRKAGGDPVRAGLATYFFGISQTVTPPVTWMCNRQDLFVVIGVTTAAAAYWDACRRPRLRLLLIAVGAFAFALLSKEIAVALAAVVCIHEIVVRRKEDARPGRAMAGKIAVTMLLMVVGYLAYYIYTRPWVITGSDGSPSQLGPGLPLSLLLYAAVWTVGFPIDVLHAATDAQVLAVAGAAGILLLLTIVFLRRSTRGDPAALFFVLWAILFILPGLRALTASTRTLCSATIGWSYLLVSLLVPSHRDRPAAPLPFRVWMNTANGVISAGCAIATVLFLNGAELDARERIQRTVAALPGPLHDGDALIFDRAQSSLEMMCAGDRLEFLSGRRNVSVNFLVGPGIDASLLPEDDHTIVAKAGQSDLFDSAIHRLSLGRGKRPSVGQRFELRNFVAEVAEISKDHKVQAVRFRFCEPLVSPRLHFSPPELATVAHVKLAVPGTVGP